MVLKVLKTKEKTILENTKMGVVLAAVTCSLCRQRKKNKYRLQQKLFNLSLNQIST